MSGAIHGPGSELSKRRWGRRETSEGGREGGGEGGGREGGKEEHKLSMGTHALAHCSLVWIEKSPYHPDFPP